MATIEEAYKARALATVKMAQLAQRLGYTVVRTTGSEEVWPVLYIELPEGQISYHFSWEDRHLIEQFPVNDAHTWDGLYNGRDEAFMTQLGVHEAQPTVRTCQFRSMSCTKEGCRERRQRDLCLWLEKNNVAPTDVYEIQRSPIETLVNKTYVSVTRVTWLQRTPASVDMNI